MQSGSQHGQGSHYKQELDRTLHVLGNVMITISGVAPTASVFIIAPIAYFVADLRSHFRASSSGESKPTKLSRLMSSTSRPATAGPLPAGMLSLEE